jgi:hypothetical protein
VTDLQDQDEELKASFKHRKRDEASTQVKDLRGLPKEIQTHITSLAAKTTPQQCQEKITKVLGRGWEMAPTVKMERTKERLNKTLLAGIFSKIVAAPIRSVRNWVRALKRVLSPNPYAWNYQCRYAIIWLV